jgi:Mrr N-terminal domain
LGTNTAENTALRLKAVLDILAEPSAEADQKLNRNAVLAQAIERVPLTAHESGLLSSGVPRGEKALTTATAKLVKAGWIVKEGRTLWSITDAGRQARADFPEIAELMDALQNHTSAAAKAEPKAAPKSAAGKTAKAAAKPAEDKAAAKAAETEAVLEDAVRGSAEASAVPTAENEPDIAEESDEAPVETFPQPEAVAIAGTLNTVLGCPADWAPERDEVQLRLDPKDQLWKLTVDLPAGTYTYKAALNRSWDENYGAFGHRDGANIDLHHPGGAVTFHYDHRTKTVSTS